MDRLTALQALVAVAETGSLSRAAAAMSVNVSSVSRAIAEMEADLGASMFNRSTRGLHLTEAGGVFIRRLKPILDQLEDARAEAGALNATPTGRLRVLAPAALARGLLAPLLPDFLQRFPDIAVELATADQESGAAQQLIKRGMDLAIVEGDVPDSGLLMRRITQGGWRLVASAAWIARHGMPDSPDAVRETGQALTCQPSQAWEFSRGSARQTQPNLARLVVASSDLAAAVARQAGGVALLPDWMFATPEAAGLVTLLADWQVTPEGAPDSSLFAVFPRKKVVPPKTRVFIEHIAAVLAGSTGS